MPMTTSAPMLAATLAGTGLTMPPSTSVRLPIRTAGKTPGTAPLAKIAAALLPRRRTTSSCVSTSVATTAIGIGSSSSRRPPNSLRGKPRTPPVGRKDLREPSGGEARPGAGGEQGLPRARRPEQARAQPVEEVGDAVEIAEARIERGHDRPDARPGEVVDGNAGRLEPA